MLSEQKSKFIMSYSNKHNQQALQTCGKFISPVIAIRFPVILCVKGFNEAWIVTFLPKLKAHNFFAMKMNWQKKFEEYSGLKRGVF